MSGKRCITCVETKQVVRQTVDDMFKLADDVEDTHDNDAVRWYRQGKVDTLRQWAKTMEPRFKRFGIEEIDAEREYNG